MIVGSTEQRTIWSEIQHKGDISHHTQVQYSQCKQRHHHQTSQRFQLVDSRCKDSDKVASLIKTQHKGDISPHPGAIFVM